MSAAPYLPLLDRAPEPTFWISHLWQGYWNCGYACLATVPFALFLCNLSAATLMERLPVLEVLLLRSVMTIVLVLTFQTAQKGRPLFTLGSRARLVVLHTLIAVAASVCGFTTISLLPLADALTLIYSNIAITAFIGWLSGLESMRFGLGRRAELSVICRWFGFVGVGLCVAGIVFVVQPTFLFPQTEGEADNRSLGTAVGIANSLLVSILLILKRAIGTTQRPDVLCLYSTAAMLPVAILSLAVGAPERPIFVVELKEWGLLVVNAVGGYISGVLVNRGAALVSGTLGAISGSLQMLLAHASDTFLMDEPFSVFVLVGSICMLLGSIATGISLNS